MQVKAIDNSNQNIRFKANADVQMATAFVNMNDKQLKDLAYLSTVNDKDNKRGKKSALAMFYAIPVVDIIANGILPTKRTNFGIDLIKNASLGQRATSAGRTAGGWAMILAVIGVYNGIKKAVVNDSKSVKKFDQNHPVLSFMTDIALIFGGLSLVNKGIRKLGGNKEIPFIKLKRILAKGKQNLDNTKLSKEILPVFSEGASKLAEKAPRTAKFAKGAIALSPIIVFFAGIFKMAHQSSKENKKMHNNYYKLKDAQFKTAKNLANTLAVQKDILVKDNMELIKDNQELEQEHKDLVKELKHTKHKHHHPEPADDEKVVDK